MSEYSSFSDSRRFNYESKLLSERLEKQYLRQKIDSQINNRLISSPERDVYRSPVRDDNIRYLSPSSIQDRLISNYNISNIQRTNQFLGDSIKRLNIQQKGASLYQSPSKITPTSNNPEYQRNAENFLQFDLDRKQREQRKRDIMSKINELNQKLNSESSTQSNHYAQSYLTSSQNNLITSGSYTSPINKLDKVGSNTSLISTQNQQPSYYLSKYEQNPRQDNVVEKTSPKLESQPTPQINSHQEKPHSSAEEVNHKPTLKSESSPKADFNGSLNNESKLKQEIQRLESTNNTLINQVEKLERQHEEITLRLKEQLHQSNQENQKLKESTKGTIDYKAAFESEKKKNETLMVQCQQFEVNLKQQNQEMSESLKEIKQNYEEKLQQFEQLLQESNLKIQNIQTQYSDDPLIKAIKENPQILEFLTEKLNEEEGQSDPQQAKRTASLEKLLERKEEIIRELSRNNELKDLEIKKMEELIEKFKALFSHMNEEKEILTAENDRLNDELEQYKSYISKVMSYSLGGKKLDQQNDEELAEGEEDDQQEGYENEDDQGEGEEQDQEQEQEGDGEAQQYGNDDDNGDDDKAE